MAARPEMLMSRSSEIDNPYVLHLSRFLGFVDETDLSLEIFCAAVCMVLTACLLVGVLQVGSVLLAVMVSLLLIGECFQLQRFDWTGAWEEVESFTHPRTTVIV